jgi:carbon storage regulator
MLVLSRQRDESIIIGDNVIITVIDIRGDKVRLGIEAPKEVPVHRQEVYDAIQRENMKAGRAPAKDETSPPSAPSASSPPPPQRSNKRKQRRNRRRQ